MTRPAETFTPEGPTCVITIEKLREAVATLKEYAKPDPRSVVVVSHEKAYFGIVEDDDSVTRTSHDFDPSELQFFGEGVTRVPTAKANPQPKRKPYEALRDSRW